MKALILAGGYGTRLHPITLRTSKCVLPLAGVPNIVYIINELKKAGVKDVTISINRNQESIRRVLGDGKGFGIRLRYVIEQSSSDKDKLGAIGAMKYVLDQIGTDDFIIMGADNYFQGLEINKMLSFHKKKKPDATVALFELNDRSIVNNFGIAVVEKDRIIAFQEKPDVEDALSTLASTSIYIMNKNFLDVHLQEYMKHHWDKADRPGDLWVHFAKKINIGGFTFSGFWGDIGNIKTYLSSNREAMNMLENKVSEKARISEYAEVAGEHIQINDDVIIEDDVVIKGPVVIGKNCVIRKGTDIGPYVMLLGGTEVGEKCEIEGSVIFENVNIGSEVKIRGSIIDGKSVIGNESIIEDGCIIGYSSNILEKSRLLPSSRIWPHITIERNAVIDGDVISESGLIKDTYYLEDD